MNYYSHLSHDSFHDISTQRSSKYAILLVLFSLLFSSNIVENLIGENMFTAHIPTRAKQQGSQMYVRYDSNNCLKAYCDMTCYPVFNVYRTYRSLKDSRFSTSWYVGFKKELSSELFRIVLLNRQSKGWRGGRKRERVRYTNRSDCASLDHLFVGSAKNLLRKCRRRIQHSKEQYIHGRLFSTIRIVAASIKWLSQSSKTTLRIYENLETKFDNDEIEL